MAKKNEAYVEFKANTADFQKGIKEMNAELKSSQNALKLNATQLKGTGDSVELLTERQELLQNELEASTKKVELTERSLAECEATLGKNSKEYATLSNAVLQAKNQQAAIQNELDQTASKLNAVEKENKEAASSFGQLADKIKEQENDLGALKKEYAELVITQGKGSKEAKELETKIESLSGELRDNKKQLKEAEDAADEFDKTLDDLSESAEDAGDGFTVFKGALSGIVANGFSAVVGGAKDLISNLAGLSEETREYRTEMSKLDAAFITSAFEAEDAKKTYIDLYAVLGDEGQAVEATNFLGELCHTEEELANWTTIATGVYGKFGASLPVEGLAEAANETAKVGQVTGPLADALNWVTMNSYGWNDALGSNKKALKAFNAATKEGASQEEAFNAALAECSTEKERSAMITTVLTSMYEENAAQFEDTNGAIIEANRSQAEYTDTMAAFGAKVEPITTTLKSGFNGLLQEILGLTEGADIEGFTSAIESGFATVKDTVLPAVVEGFGKLKEAWQWLSEHTGLLITVASVIGVITTAITAYNVVQGIKTAMDAANVTTVWALVSAHVAQAAAAMAAIAPYLAIVAAIAAVIAIIVLCVKHWDTIKAKITEVAQKVKEKVLEIKENVVGKLTEAKQKAVDIFNNIKTSISEKIQAAKDKVTNTVENLRSGFVDKINSLKEKASTIFSSLKEKLTSPVESAKKTISDTVEKIKGVFDFKWSLPKLKIPKISVSGGKAPYGIAGKGSLPKFSIQWNAKGGLFTKPTVLQGFGEAGHEYAIPLNERSVAPLAAMINKLTAAQGGNGLPDVLASRFDAAVDKLADRLERLEMAVNIDGERVATVTAPHSDRVGGTRYELINRGLAIK